MFGCETTKIFAMFKGVQKRTTHFEKIAFKVNALAFQRIKIVRKPEYRGDFILQFSHVFWTIFAMGTYTVDQISFNGNVYAEIRKSTLYDIFDLNRLHRLIAL